MINNILALAPVKTIVDLYSKLDTLCFKAYAMLSTNIGDDRDYYYHQALNEKALKKARLKNIQRMQKFREMRRNAGIRRSGSTTTIQFKGLFDEKILFIISLPLAYLGYRGLKKMKKQHRAISDEYVKALYGSDSVLKPYSFWSLQQRVERFGVESLIYTILVIMPFILFIKILLNGFDIIYFIKEASTASLSIGLGILMIILLVVLLNLAFKNSDESIKNAEENIKKAENDKENPEKSKAIIEENKELIEAQKKSKDNTSYLIMKCIACTIFIIWVLAKSKF